MPSIMLTLKNEERNDLVPIFQEFTIERLKDTLSVTQKGKGSISMIEKHSFQECRLT